MTLALGALAVLGVVAVWALFLNRGPASTPIARPMASASASATALASPVASATTDATAAPARSAGESETPGATSEPSVVLVGAGDIADCGSTGDEATAALLDVTPGTVFTLGDNVYPSGTADQFAACYGPSWGRHAERTYPAVGNHDYETQGAAGYHGYFGDVAGRPGEGWYSYDIGGWHVIVLNSICAAVGGCHAGSAQETWLRADLAGNPAECTIAYWHNPRFSSAQHGSDPAYDAFWRALYDAGADVVLAGHDHVYERFEPQTPDGVADAASGIRQFTVGTGGRSLYSYGAPLPTSEELDNTTLGVLKLTLRPAGYDWEFLPVEGGTFTDTGSDTCH